MKKNSILLTGILFVTAVLATGSCSTGEEPQDTKRRVEINCKAVIVEGAIQFEMYDSNDPTNVGPNIITDVKPKTIVTWLWTADSEIQKFVKINPQGNGPIMPGKARRVPFTNKLRLRVPHNAPIPSAQEKYDIEFVDEDGHTYPPIDPYLRIPDINQ